MAAICCGEGCWPGGGGADIVSGGAERLGVLWFFLKGVVVPSDLTILLGAPCERTAQPEIRYCRLSPNDIKSFVQAFYCLASFT